MTKAELIKALEDVPDDAVLIVPPSTNSERDVYPEAVIIANDGDRHFWQRSFQSITDTTPMVVEL